MNSMNDIQRYELVEPKAASNSITSIGEGAYGVVYKAIDRVSNKLVALKKIRVQTEGEIGISSSTLREITLLMQLDHENVVKLENVVMDRVRINLVFELIDSDLKRYMEGTVGLLPLHQVQSFSAQLISGIEYCHSMGVMHRDLKPHNILVTLNGRLKIADFGLARTFSAFNRPLTIEVITRYYRAPEVLLGHGKYTCSVDIWSIGCIIAEMSNKIPLFLGNCDADQLHRIFQILGTPHASDWEEIEDLPYYRSNFPQWPAQPLALSLPYLDSRGVELVGRMLVYNPRQRISAKESLVHAFIGGGEMGREIEGEGRYATPPKESKGGRGAVGKGERGERGVHVVTEEKERVGRKGPGEGDGEEKGEVLFGEERGGQEERGAKRGARRGKGVAKEEKEEREEESEAERKGALRAKRGRIGAKAKEVESEVDAEEEKGEGVGKGEERGKEKRPRRSSRLSQH